MGTGRKGVARQGEGLSKQGAGPVGTLSRAGRLAMPSREPVRRGSAWCPGGVGRGVGGWRMQDPGQSWGEGRQRGWAVGFLPSRCPAPSPPGLLGVRIPGPRPVKPSLSPTPEAMELPVSRVLLLQEELPAASQLSPRGQDTGNEVSWEHWKSGSGRLGRVGLTALHATQRQGHRRDWTSSFTRGSSQQTKRCIHK